MRKIIILLTIILSISCSQKEQTIVSDDGMKSIIDTLIEHPGYNDSEMQLAGYMMAALGYYNLGDTTGIRKCIEYSKNIYEYDTISALTGYFNFMLSLHTSLVKNSPYKYLNKKYSAALWEVIEKDLYIETYPEETYPPDNAVVLASIGMSGLIDSKKIRDLGYRQWIKAKDRNGLIKNNIEDKNGTGSATAYTLFFNHYASPYLSYKFYVNTKNKLVREFCCGYASKEYGGMTIDSGPIFKGFSVVSTGFMLGAAKNMKDTEIYNGILNNAKLVGFYSNHQYKGGFIANTIMFGLTTIKRD